MPPLFMAMQKTLTNNCDCYVCKTIRQCIKKAEKDNNAIQQLNELNKTVSMEKVF
jgi:hypothetical protein